MHQSLPLVLRLSANVFGSARAFRAIGSLYLGLASVVLAGFLLSLWLGDAVLVWVVAALPLGSLSAYLYQRKQQARKDAALCELRLTQETLELFRAGVAVLSAPLLEVSITPCVYRAGGRTVMELPCLEFEGKSFSLGIALAQPDQLWTERLREAGITPAHLVDAAAWQELLLALGLSPSGNQAQSA